MAMVQVMVYVGAVLVLIVFGVMMTGRPEGGHEKDTHTLHRVSASAVALLLFVVLWQLTGNFSWGVGADFVHPVSSDKSIHTIAEMLLGKYLFPFEIVSVLLLGVVVGAVMIARREEDR